MCDKMLTDYYQKGFGSERHRQGQMINAKTNAWVIGQLLNRYSIGNVLDVGTGYGFFLKELQILGLQTTGVELSEQEAKYGLEHLNVDIRNCMLDQAGIELHSFDLVTCFEVLEHIPNPPEFIDELLQYLKPGGQLLIMTDNFECSVAKKLGAGFPKWIPHSHISHFGPNTLQTLLLAKGLRITGRMSYTPWELIARSFYYKLRSIQKTPQESFSLVKTLQSEMTGSFRLFELRRLINTFWTKCSIRNNLDGALMYVTATQQ